MCMLTFLLSCGGGGGGGGGDGDGENTVEACLFNA